MNPAKEDVITLIKDMTDGYGCDIYIEATGAQKAVDQGLTLLRKLGTFVEFSVFKDPVTVTGALSATARSLMFWDLTSDLTAIR
ncbi:L-threonine 3-dehydrogenase [Budvicia aquatica]|uniref:L-threonine 3-dehydrogenase n=1 Tax=Budvicia aquatica TaxID=82979 RepID=A0A484ZFP3_9GAMM|nr:L-threonine 3-dehydrogenase [Budvicia aquatica]